MTSYKFGDVVLVPFPFTNLESSKKRPAVVVSADTYDDLQPDDTLILAITSQVEKSDFVLGAWEDAGLLKKSAFKPLIVSIDKSRIQKKLGTLKEEDRTLLFDLLEQIIAKRPE